VADKLKFGFYWAASCGGCEIAVLDTNEKLLDIVAGADILLWPVAMDTKRADMEAMPDKHMDVCFFNGSVRTSEQEEWARLLRRKAKTLVAFGSCAHHGCIPGLANLHSRKEVFETAYYNEPSLDESKGTEPQTSCKVPEGELTLPTFYDGVFPLDQVVDVDYYLPGCPPPVPLILAAVTAIFEGRLPAKGTVLAPVKALCDECSRNKHEAKKMPDIKRTWEVAADPEKCFLEQGIICMGPVTRAGCETRCINGNSPCTGCLGPTPEVKDQGAKMVSALASILRVDDEQSMTEPETVELLKKIKDPVGTFYMYGLASATINRRRKQ
jgi:F420-non-reducing hydrogenase small subunit